MTNTPLNVLIELRSAAIQFRDAAYRDQPSLRVSNEAVNMLSAWLLAAGKVIAAAEKQEA